MKHERIGELLELSLMYIASKFVYESSEKTVCHFHVFISGARNVQTRLVEPSVESMNSGDVFILVTPKQVHQWNGKFCSIMEKARVCNLSLDFGMKFMRYVFTRQFNSCG